SFGEPTPVRGDSIFRISSMTKPITAVAAMILVEECRLRLDEPVDRLLPELSDRRVLTRLDGPLDETVPAHRAITLRDLLSFRMGFGQVYESPETLPIYNAANEMGIGMGPPQPSSMPEPDEWLRRLGQLPLMHQPGERWMYNTGSDVLGVLIKRASGQPFEAFLKERIFGPLGMRDTGFSVPAADLARLTTSYMADQGLGELSINDEPAGGQWSVPPAFPSGAAGLVSTAIDYLRFGEMMLACGQYEGVRILSRPSVETMTTDHLTPQQKAVSGFFPGYFDNRGWGFGVCVITRRDDLAAVPGRYGWDGGLGTSWYSDPREGLTAILMTQRAAFPLFSNVYLDFWTSVYQAIED
ncbi:MAG TPA: serine hydrolase domain-containing protein, partial [Dehalococcoidia bacterium]|nr:serine hydrolase domain-containing protein [Dehalococcoidia bacterium]